MKPRHLSPSALEAYDWCPMHRYARSYRDRQSMQPNFPVWFGQAVHHGLEAMKKGEDWELSFMRKWKLLHGELDDAMEAGTFEGNDVPERTSYGWRGLALIQSVVDLGLNGETEWAFLEKLDGLSIPVKGFVDLLDKQSHRIYDYKTAGRIWSQDYADKKVWQPSLYSLVYEKKFGAWPSFHYVVLPTSPWLSTNAVVIDRVITKDEASANVVRAQGILERIWADDFPCTCGQLKKEQKAA